MSFSLRPWAITDLDNLIKHGNNINVAMFMMNKFPHPYTRERGEQFIQYANSHQPIHLFAIDIAGEACGGIGIHPQEDIHCRNAELGYWLGEAHWGKGIVSKAIVQMVDHGFKNFDIDRIFARPFGTNIRSQKVLEKAGFKLEGRFEKTLFKNGEQLDELIYAVRKN